MNDKGSAGVWRRHLLSGMLLPVFAALGACAKLPSTPLPLTRALPVVVDTVTPAPTFTPAPTLSPTAVPTNTITPLNLQPQVVVLASDFLEPDDLVLAPDGSVYISDVRAGTIKQYTRDGRLNLFLSGLSSPEGMTFLPDGSMVIAEQGTNRLLRYDFASNTLVPFLDLGNNTRQLGVDGIFWNGSELIVPDSPNGTVLAVSADGSSIRQLASGLARPTGAWAEADGKLLIADENGNAILRLHPDGTVEKVASLPVPDDVAADPAGNIFVATIGDNAIHVITAQNNQDIVLVSGLVDPQGIIFDMEGNLIVTDSGNHQLLKILIHGAT
jgi:sugar lactone lactonase YvrE